MHNLDCIPLDLDSTARRAIMRLPAGILVVPVRIHLNHLGDEVIQ